MVVHVLWLFFYGFSKVLVVFHVVLWFLSKVFLRFSRVFGYLVLLK